LDAIWVAHTQELAKLISGESRLDVELLQFSELGKRKVWIDVESRFDRHSGLLWVYCLIEPDLVGQHTLSMNRIGSLTGGGHARGGRWDASRGSGKRDDNFVK